MRNSKQHPEAWAFYIEHARNIEDEDSLPGKYRIPKPNRSGDFIYADSVEKLWAKFIQAWYNPDLNSESIRGKIQYIARNF